MNSIRDAYMTVLDREPDPEGMRVYTNMLLTGCSIESIIQILEQSDENMSTHTDVSICTNIPIIPTLTLLHMPYQSCTLVVARYDEDVTWLCGMDYVLYNKGNEQLLGLSRTNIGREGETYLWHIIHRYEMLREYIIFTQGDPFVHNPVFMTAINDPHMLSFQPLSAWWSPDVPPCDVRNNSVNVTVNGTYAHMHIANKDLVCVSPRLWIDDGFINIVKRIKIRNNISGSILQWFCDKMDIHDVPDAIPVSMCGMFGVHRDIIMRRPVSFYIRLREFLLDHVDHGYIVERLWAFIMT